MASTSADGIIGTSAAQSRPEGKEPHIMAKTTCGEHRVTGYAYRYDNSTRRSSLVCRACGLPDTQHETIAETIQRLTLGNINLKEEGK